MSATGVGLRPILLRMLQGRVGSVLTMQLLGTSPDVAFDRIYPLEHCYLTYFTRLTSRVAATSADPTVAMAEFVYTDSVHVGPMPFTPGHLDVDDLARRSLRAMWREFSESWNLAATHRAHFYAEKYFGDITPVLAAGLDPLVIDLVRDPRDIVASARAFIRRRGEQLFGRAEALDDREHLRLLVLSMTMRLREFDSALPVPRISVRYEDLVNDLPGQTARICELTGLELHPEQVVAARDSMAQHITSASVNSSVGRWRTDLSDEDVRVIERRLAAQMTKLGYEPSTAAPSA